jgi:hypothetical protein
MTLADNNPTLPIGHEPQEYEERLWRHDVTKGFWRKKVVHFYLVTTKHLVSGQQVLNIDDLVDCVAVNEESVHDGGFNSVGVKSGNVSVRTGGYRGRGKVIGDVIFTGINGCMIFHDIPVPNSIVRLVKSLMKARKQRARQ